MRNKKETEKSSGRNWNSYFWINRKDTQLLSDQKKEINFSLNSLKYFFNPDCRSKNQWSIF